MHFFIAFSFPSGKVVLDQGSCFIEKNVPDVFFGAPRRADIWIRVFSKILGDPGGVVWAAPPPSRGSEPSPSAPLGVTP